MRHQGTYKSLKRILDVVGVVVGLVVAAPMLAVMAVAIKLDSRGPVLVRQTHVGENGRLFGLYRFRTMLLEPDALLHRRYVDKLVGGQLGPERGAPLVKLANDPRVSRVGRFLKRTSMEQLPQLLNVLKGDLSIVGPRAAMPYEVPHYEEWQLKRLIGKPGMTGLWQVSSCDASFDEMVRMDIEYLERQSTALDFKIILRTIAVIFRSNA